MSRDTRLSVQFPRSVTKHNLMFQYGPNHSPALKHSSLVESEFIYTYKTYTIQSVHVYIYVCFSVRLCVLYIIHLYTYVNYKLHI